MKKTEVAKRQENSMAMEAREQKWTKRWKLTSTERNMASKTYLEMVKEIEKERIVGGLAQFLLLSPISSRMFKLGFVMARRMYKPDKELAGGHASAATRNLPLDTSSISE